MGGCTQQPERSKQEHTLEDNISPPSTTMSSSTRQLCNLLQLHHHSHLPICSLLVPSTPRIINIPLTSSLIDHLCPRQRPLRPGQLCLHVCCSCTSLIRILTICRLAAAAPPSRSASARRTDRPLRSLGVVPEHALYYVSVSKFHDEGCWP